MGQVISLKGNENLIDEKIWKEQYPPYSKNARMRFKFLSVDVWRAKFGPQSVSAVFEIYSQVFNIPSSTMKKNPRRYSFQFCLEALRKKENPDYISAGARE